MPHFECGDRGSSPRGGSNSLCRCSSAEERRSHTAKVGCSIQPTGTSSAMSSRRRARLALRRPSNPCGSSTVRTPECESGDARSIRAPGTKYPDQTSGRLTEDVLVRVQLRRPWGCSSAEERRSPKPCQRGFDPCHPCHLSLCVMSYRKAAFVHVHREGHRSSPARYCQILGVHHCGCGTCFNLLKNKAFPRSNLLGPVRD